MKVALVHDYLNQMGGAERVVLAFHELFPDAPLYTSIYDPKRVDAAFQKIDIQTSFMQRPAGSTRSDSSLDLPIPISLICATSWA